MPRGSARGAGAGQDLRREGHGGPNQGDVLGGAGDDWRIGSQIDLLNAEGEPDPIPDLKFIE